MVVVVGSKCCSGVATIFGVFLVRQCGFRDMEVVSLN